MFIVLLMAMSVTGLSLVDETLLYGQFPADFKWAAATSAYQIEGGLPILNIISCDRSTHSSIDYIKRCFLYNRHVANINF